MIPIIFWKRQNCGDSKKSIDCWGLGAGKDQSTGFLEQ